MEKDVPGIRRSSYLLLLSFLLMSAGIIGVGVFAYRQFEADHLETAKKQLSTIADLKKHEIARWREEWIRDANVLYRNNTFARLVSRYFQNPEDREAGNEIKEWLGRAQEDTECDRMCLHDAAGAERLAVPARGVCIPSRFARSSREALRSERIIFEDLYRNEYDHRMYLSILVPIIDLSQGGKAIGVVGIRIDPERYLYPLINRWPVPSRTAETLLVRRDGDEIVFLNPLRFRPDASITLRFPLSHAELPAAMAASGKEGIVEGVDYRDVPVLADVGPVPGSPWFMIARMDMSEVIAPIRMVGKITLAIAAAFLLAAGAVIFLLWRREGARFYHERYRAAEEMLRLSSRHEAILSAVTDIIMETDARKVYTWANRAGYEFFGADVIGKEASHYFIGEQDTYEKVKPLFDGDERVFYVESRQRRRDGEERILAWWSKALKDGEHRVVGAVSSARDITEHKRAEEILWLSDNRFRMVSRATHDAVRDWDLRTHSVWWNENFLSLFGYRPEEIEPNLESWTGRLHPEDRDRIVGGIHAAIDGGKVHWSDRYRFRRGDGSYAEVYDRGYILRKADGRAERMIGSMQDVTDLRQKERELARKNIELERFVYTISHDLKSPLVTAQTFLGYLEKDLAKRDAASTEKDMRYIRAATERMSVLLDELLEMSRIGRVVNPPTRITFRKIVEDALSSVAGRIAEGRVKIAVSDEPSVLCGDRRRLSEIWQNLIENAVKFMGGQRAPRIDIGLDRCGAETVFFVRDNGMGIDPKYHEKVFTLFEKLDPRSDGTGLGLALVKRVVEMYDGRIWIESEGDAGGTCVRFTLPGAAEEERDPLPGREPHIPEGRPS